jgi:hypothetical protein
VLKLRYVVPLLLLLLIVVAIGSPTYADEYQITFTLLSGGGPIPPRVDFSYVAGTGFTSDIVGTWGIYEFDFTASYLDYFGFAGCSAPIGSGAVAFAVLTSTRPCASFPFGPYWVATTGMFSICGSQCLAAPLYTFVPGPPNPYGDVQVTDITSSTPEAGSFSMLFSGLIGLGLLVGMKQRRRSPRFSEA